MDNFETLLESFDSKYFTPEIKSKITECFNNKVQEKAEEIANEMIEEAKVELYEQYQEQLNSQTDETDSIKEEYHDKIDKLDDQFEDALTEAVQEYEPLIDEYLDKALEEALTDIRDKLEANLNEVRANAILECTRTLAALAQVQQGDIDQARSEIDEDYSANKEQLNATINDLMESNRKLTEENAKLLKTGIINELAEDLSLTESEKFKDLADKLVPFSRDQAYLDKLESLKNQVIFRRPETLDESYDEYEDEDDNELLADPKPNIWDAYC